MKKNTYRILITVIILVVFCDFLIGCSCDADPGFEALQSTTRGSTQTEVTDTDAASEILTGWKAAYKAVIVNTLKECKEKHSCEMNHGGYGLYNFDNDSIPELFLEVYGSTMPDYYIYVYDFIGDEAVFLDRIQSAHSWVYGTDKENSVLLGTSGTGGEFAWSILNFSNGSFDCEYITSYFPYGFGDTIDPEENPLPGMGYEIEDIEYYGLDDISGIADRNDR